MLKVRLLDRQFNEIIKSTLKQTKEDAMNSIKIVKELLALWEKNKAKWTPHEKIDTLRAAASLPRIFTQQKKAAHARTHIGGLGLMVRIERQGG